MKSGKDKKSILVVSQYFWPEDFRVNELVIGFQENGYNVEVLTGRPNYPFGTIFKEFQDNPKKFYNYRDIKVHRVQHFLRGSNKLSLLFNYISFPLMSCLYCVFKLNKKNYDIIFGVQLSPIFSVIAAILYKKLFRTPLYLWVLDIWPDSVLSANISPKGFLYRSLEKLCRMIYSSADVLFLSSNGFLRRLRDMKVSGPKLIELPQWVETSYIQNVELGGAEDCEVKKIISPWRGKKIFLFAGNIGEAQDFSSILAAFKASDCLDELVFLILGDGRYKDTMLDKINTYELSGHVFYLGRYPSEYMPLFYHYADVLVFALLDIPIFRLTLPGKIQSYMSSGTPIIGMVSGEAATVITNAKCGFTVPSGEVRGFSNLIKNCCSESPEKMNILGKNGRKYAELNFSYSSLIERATSHF